MSIIDPSEDRETNQNDPSDVFDRCEKCGAISRNLDAHRAQTHDGSSGNPATEYHITVGECPAEAFVRGSGVKTSGCAHLAFGATSVTFCGRGGDTAGNYITKTGTYWRRSASEFDDDTPVCKECLHRYWQRKRGEWSGVPEPLQEAES